MPDVRGNIGCAPGYLAEANARPGGAQRAGPAGVIDGDADHVGKAAAGRRKFGFPCACYSRDWDNNTCAMFCQAAFVLRQLVVGSLTRIKQELRRGARVGEAAAALGVRPTTFKALLRAFGLPYWPARQAQASAGKLAELQGRLAACAPERRAELERCVHSPFPLIERDRRTARSPDLAFQSQTGAFF